MKKRLNDYIKIIEQELTKKHHDKNLAEEILTEISFFQHERLVHLIVTVFAGISTIIFLISFIYFEVNLLLLLFLITLLLFISYIFHYYSLENGVQKLYYLYWKAKGK